MKYRNIKTIISREYMTRVRKKSFLLITFLGPIFFAAICVLPAIIMNFTSEDQKKIALVDESGIILPRVYDTEIIDFNDYTGRCVDSLKAQMTDLDIDIILAISPLDTTINSVICPFNLRTGARTTIIAPINPTRAIIVPSCIFPYLTLL